MYTDTKGRNRSSRGGATGRGARRGRRGGHQGPNRQELALRAREERQTHIEVNKMFIIHYNLHFKERFYLFTYLYIISNYHCRNVFQTWKQRD